MKCRYKVLRPALLQLKDLAPEDRASTIPLPDTDVRLHLLQRPGAIYSLNRNRN
ncbi:MAG TPA: hypothetical protein VEU94_08980 [Terriglobales bacterium]|nr:hypothetical protein [Terriglobales bacterium]